MDEQTTIEQKCNLLTTLNRIVNGNENVPKKIIEKAGDKLVEVIDSIK